MKYNPSQLMHDLNTCYLSILRDNRSNGIELTRREICELISQCPAPRFYVTVEYARRIINCAIEGRRRTRVLHSRRNAQHQEIFERYKNLPIDEQNNTGLAKLLNEPAPSFYFSAKQISNLLYKALR